VAYSIQAPGTTWAKLDILVYRTLCAEFSLKLSHKLTGNDHIRWHCNTCKDENCYQHFSLPAQQYFEHVQHSAADLTKNNVQTDKINNM